MSNPAQDILRAGMGATEMTQAQLPAFAAWLAARGYTVVTGTNGVTDAIVHVRARSPGERAGTTWCAHWTARSGRVQCTQAAHLGGPVAAEFLREVASG